MPEAGAASTHHVATAARPRTGTAGPSADRPCAPTRPPRREIYFSLNNAERIEPSAVVVITS